MKLILHYPTYFTIVSLMSYDGHDETSCSSSCNTAVAQRLARGAHNSEVTRSKRVSGIILFACFIVLPHNPPASSWGVQKLAVICYATLNIACIHTYSHRSGAEAARGAHNPEDTGSKPVSGTLPFTRFTETGMFLIITLSTTYLLKLRYCLKKPPHYRCSSEAERLNNPSPSFQLFGFDLGMVIAL